MTRVSDMLELTGLPIVELDLAIDHMREIGLLFVASGLNYGSRPETAPMSPSALALHMIARCNGTRDVYEFYGLDPAKDRYDSRAE